VAFSARLPALGKQHKFVASEILGPKKEEKWCPEGSDFGWRAAASGLSPPRLHTRQPTFLLHCTKEEGMARGRSRTWARGAEAAASYLVGQIHFFFGNSRKAAFRKTSGTAEKSALFIATRQVRMKHAS